jgi:hypothetical protein
MGRTESTESQVGKPEGRRALGRPRCRWDNNIKMEFNKLGA